MPALLAAFFAGCAGMGLISLSGLAWLDEQEENEATVPEQFGSVLVSAALFVVAVGGALWIWQARK